MSAPAIAGRQESAATICAVCARQALHLAYCPSSDLRRAIWLCEACIPLARKVYSMKNIDLSAFEARAIDAAASKAVPTLLDAILTALWENQVEALSDVTPELLAKLEGEPPEAVRDAIAGAVINYAAAMREDLSKHNPPF